MAMIKAFHVHLDNGLQELIANIYMGTVWVFCVVLESPTLDINNWVYDFGKFKFLENWLKRAL